MNSDPIKVREEVYAEMYSNPGWMRLDHKLQVGIKSTVCEYLDDVVKAILKNNNITPKDV